MKQETRIKTERKLQDHIEKLTMAYVSDELNSNFFKELVQHTADILKMVYASNNEDYVIGILCNNTSNRSSVYVSGWRLC